MTTVKKKIAVITRTKNRTVLLRRAILSVAQQEWRDYVHVIVNDGGDEQAIFSLISSLPPTITNNIQIIHLKLSLGMEHASNVAIKSSSSEYIAIHDDDDSWQPTFLKRTIEHMDSNPHSQGVATNTYLLQEIVTQEKIKLLNSYIYKPHIKQISLYEMASENIFPPIAFVYRRKILSEIGYYDESLKVLGDWEFNLRFLMLHDIDFIDMPLANYHIRRNKILGNSVTNNQTTHAVQRNLINNSYMRKYLNEPNSNIGLLVNIAPKLNDLLSIQTIKTKVRNLIYKNRITIYIRKHMPDQHAKILTERFR